MTILCDSEIQRDIESGRIGIRPAPDFETQLQPASLDLRLGNRFTRFLPKCPGNLGVIDTKYADVAKMMKTSTAEAVEVISGGFVLAHTREYVRIPSDIVAVVDGRSSLGRLGLMVHVTAGYIDPGFEGQITLELHNVGPHAIRLYSGERVCQLRFHRMAKTADRPYRGKYQGDSGAVASRLHQDTDWSDNYVDM